MTVDFDLSIEDAAVLRQQSRSVAVPSAVFRVEGTAALQCIQGIFSNDVVTRGADALAWGGVLTAKGMIIFDMWVLRDGDAAWMIVPGAMHETAKAHFARTFPPRLARVTDRTAERSVHWLLGEGAPDLPGVMRPAVPAPFSALVLAEGQVPRGIADVAPAAPADWIAAARVLAGWPATGHEIDDRTLPQEVRFDELDGVRYDKGCYTGQETVARLHFRGHANRTLRGLHWEGSEPMDATIVAAGKEVGRCTTVGRIGSDSYGMAKLRREVPDGDHVVAGGLAARVVALPFGTP